MFVAPDRLEGDGFVLRSYLPGDGQALLDAKAGSYEHLRPWMPWAKQDETLEENTELARTFRAKYLLGEQDWVIGVFSPDESTLLGGTDFRVFPGTEVDDGVGEVGMWIAAEHAGAGLGTRVLVAMLAWGLSDAWPWHRLTWRCDSANTASRRVAEHAGMSLEGTMAGDACFRNGRRDTLLFGAVAGRWRAPSAGGDDTP